MNHASFVLLLTVLPLLAQEKPGAPPSQPQQPQQQAPVPAASSAGYLLGPNDHIVVYVKDLNDDFADKTFRIDQSGDVSLPIIGHLHALGLTTSELETGARAALSHELKNPDVAISVATYGSQTVSVLGALNNPGIFQLEGHKTLFQALSLAGGLLPEAGYQATITRDLKWGPVPLPGAMTDPSGKSSSASVRIKTLLGPANEAENIPIMPGDIISVPPAEMVFAVGSVTKPGAFPLSGRETISALQVVSLAQGPTRTASLSKAMILRAVSGASRRSEIPVNLKLLLAGKGPDIQLQPDDILFIPNSNPKSAGFRTLEAITNAAGYAAIRGY
jgi:polysaccharide export outer membrane protein